MTDNDMNNILYKLGCIETNIKGIQEILAKLPCGINTERLTRLEQSFANNKEYIEDQKDTKFKLSTRTIATIAILISSANLILITYNVFFK